MKYTALILCMALLWAPYLHATPLKNTQEHFKDVYIEEGTTLKLQGAGMKWFMFLRVFVAGLYLPEGTSPEDALNADIAKRIEVHYFYDIPGKYLSNYTKKMIRANTSKEEFKDLTEELALMEKYFVDLKDGDSFALAYRPDEGTRFIYNDKVVGTIPD